MVSSSRKRISDDIPDLAEPLLDEVSTRIAKEVFGIALPEIAKELSILKYGKVMGDVYSAYRAAKLHRRLKAFLTALQSEQFTLDDFYRLSSGEQEGVVDILVTELDSQSDSLQSEALGYLFAAYINKDLDRLMFLGVAHELKNTNPLVFYFSVDGYVFDDQSKLENLTGQDILGYSSRKTFTRITSGPTQYLPSAFVSDSNGVLQSSSDVYITNLGEAFFKYIYTPMRQKHEI